MRSIVWSIAVAAGLGAPAALACGDSGARNPDAGSSDRGAEASPSGIGEVVTEVVINAPPSAVWKVFSTPGGFKRFGVAHCEMDLRVGGMIRSHYKADGVLGDGGTIANRILAFEPERMMAFCIDKPPEGFPFGDAWRGTWNVATLTDLGDGRTHLRLAGLGYGDDENARKMRAFFEAGNRWSLDALRASFESNKEEKPMSSAHPASATAPLVVERIIEQAREDVWGLLSTAEGWKRFFGVAARIEARPGGAFEIEFDEDAPPGSRGSEGCAVLSVIPGRMLSFTWNAPPKMSFARTKRTWVVIELEALSAGRTRVRLTHLGFAELARAHPDRAAEFHECRSYFSNAWVHVIEALAAARSPSAGEGGNGVGAPGRSH